MVPYKNIQFRMAELGGKVHGLMAETGQLLREELLLAGDDEVATIR